ncbi:hypothetical protein CR513_43795, partial [Mucuna pruriens]
MAGGIELAEAYVLRKQHKEKMKETEKRRTKTNRSSGCFSWFSKKLRRPARTQNKEKIVIFESN